MNEPSAIPVAWPPPVTRARRDALLPALHAAHDAEGWLSPTALDAIADELGLPRAEVFGVASFYGSFALAPRARTVRRVCVDVACALRGATPPPEAAAATDPAVVAAPCLGRCEEAPASLTTVGGEDAAEPDAVGAPTPGGSAGTHRLGDPPVGGPPAARVLLRRVGIADPRRLDEYRRHGGGRALDHARALGPDAVRATIHGSALTGRGGAGFPAGQKWDAVAAAPGPHKYVVANGDESEPGTFKDRVLMEHDPFALLEAMTIAGWAVGAERGVVYVRDEYPRARAAIAHALEEARAAGLLGDSTPLGPPFRVELRRGAGAYICGEETALFASIEGHRGEPRTKPPFPTQVGLFGRPTLVHNIETLANVLRILDPDGPAPETKLFSVSGAVRTPAVYEVPTGTTLGELLAIAGGLDAGRTLQAVLLGGAAGTFVGPEHLDTPLTPDAVRAIGATLGSGAVIVLDDTADLTAVVLRIAAFFRDESCGQCVPCRVGTVRQEEALHRLASGHPLGSRTDELTRLRDVGAAMRDASICGLGQTAWNAIESAVERFGVLR